MKRVKIRDMMHIKYVLAAQEDLGGEEAIRVDRGDPDWELIDRVEKRHVKCCIDKMSVHYLSEGTEFPVIAFADLALTTEDTIRWLRDRVEWVMEDWI